MTRFQPTRAGIINMWDYRDEEFCFADGWLVLRGPNGSGPRMEISKGPLRCYVGPGAYGLRQSICAWASRGLAEDASGLARPVPTRC